MLGFFLWYFVVSILGWVAFPAIYRLLPNLYDRGYGLSRAFGLLTWGYSFWILTSFRITQNNPGGILCAFVIVIVLSIWLMRDGHWNALKTWLRGQKKIILITEVLFFLAFAGWTLVRSTNPDIVGTEKPMELAFINAILESNYFPPFDPWLSGYSISYYYFGYVMVAMITMLTGVASWVAFNLAGALWFSLTAVSAFSIVYSLIGFWSRQNRIKNPEHLPEKNINLGWALLGPFFILIVSNLEGFLEMLHAKGIFWTESIEGGLQSKFWEWLNIQEISLPPTAPFSWQPERVAGTWWWRASRVLQDFTANGQSKEIIDEFPFFSYLLADLHPHVLSMPFVILSIGLALSFYMRPEPFPDHGLNIFAFLQKWVTGEKVKFSQLKMKNWFRQPEFWLGAFIMGALAFLNTWDFPIYVALFCAVFVLVRFQQDGWHIGLIWDFIGLGLSIGILGLILYLPFYIGFSSQAGGFLPSLHFFTRGIHLWVMFAPFLVPIIIWLISVWRKRKEQSSFKTGLFYSFGVTGGLWFISYLFGLLIMQLPALGENILNSQGDAGPLFNLSSSFIQWGQLFYGLQGSSLTGEILSGSLIRRFTNPGGWLTLIALLILVWGLLSGYGGMKKRREIPRSESDNRKDPSLTFNEYQRPIEGFILLLVLVGVGLVLVPEFIYLRDQFAWRMNTIFKFYFQAWIVWGLAGAYASVVLWKKTQKNWGLLYKCLWIILIVSSLAYPIFGLMMKFNHITMDELSLNGAAHIERYNPDEMDAIEWLLEAPQGTVLEAVGGSYSSFARVSTYSGHPTVLGWPGHESQWRGGASEIGSRESDIKKIYQSSDWFETQSLLGTYEIRYIFVGSLENSSYRINEKKFEQHFVPVFQQGSVKIYLVPEGL
ncbi:MAG: DUF2298 domain-containing protein [Anaerolineaceae bacterium]|nr:DUF2298 domain-containing protein [Anaerolineaceae bacterium]